MAFINIRTASLLVDTDTEELVKRIANLPRGLKTELAISFLSGNTADGSIDASSVKIEFFLPNDLARSNPLEASINNGEFILNEDSKQYVAELDMNEGMISYLSLPTIIGRISATGFTSKDFHVVINSTANTQVPVNYYPSAQGATQSLVDQVNAANTSVLGRGEDVYTVVAGDKVITRDIPAGFTGEDVDGEPVMVAEADYDGRTFKIEEWKVNPDAGTYGQLIITLSGKITATAAGHYTIKTQYEKFSS